MNDIDETDTVELGPEDSDKFIAIAVTGSISAYRSCELVRELVKKGYPVRVLMTANAERFIGRLTFQALTGHPINGEEWQDGLEHINFKRGAAVFGVAPATANIIGKFAAGIADDIVSTTYLSVDCPVVIAPAMNPEMYSSKAVQRNLKRLQEDGNLIFSPTAGETVCGDIGEGKLADIAEIEQILIERFNLSLTKNRIA